jgi:hypothetical protein
MEMIGVHRCERAQGWINQRGSGYVLVAKWPIKNLPSVHGNPCATLPIPPQKEGRSLGIIDFEVLLFAIQEGI